MKKRIRTFLRWQSDRPLDPLVAAYMLHRLQERCGVCPECDQKWDWLGNHRNALHHAVIELNGVRYPVKSLAWAATTLRVKPVDRVLVSKCHHPTCINPKLAAVVTKGDVVHKQIADGLIHTIHHRRQIQVGRRKRSTKMNMEKAQAIRVSDKSTKELAQEYGVSRQTICRIRSGLQWMDLNSPFAGVFSGLVAANENRRRA